MCGTNALNAHELRPRCDGNCDGCDSPKQDGAKGNIPTAQTSHEPTGSKAHTQCWLSVLVTTMLERISSEHKGSLCFMVLEKLMGPLAESLAVLGS